MRPEARAGRADPARGWGRLIDISNERYPLQVSSIRLPISMAENAEKLKEDNADYATHFVSVDDRHNAKLAFISWYSSGLRVWDISDPYDPEEIGYYIPYIPGARINTTLKLPERGRNNKYVDVYAYPRYRPETGHIWTASIFSGAD
ncbi:MAG: hypothetical protein HY655_12580 [Acidobacteria bacterium]|nr:hypothetical protein [Acidobacteriota bacterium]